MFKTPKKKKSIQSLQLQGLKNDVSLFGRIYIANQQREGDLPTFFSHENQLYPRSISEHGKIRATKKSHLIKCLPTLAALSEETKFDYKVFDGAALIHMLKPTATVTFQNYADEIFFPYVKNELVHCNRIDIVWDEYREQSIKGSTREKRGTGIRRRNFFFRTPLAVSVFL